MIKSYIQESFLDVCYGMCEHAIRSEYALMTLQKHHVAELAFWVDSDVLCVTLFSVKIFTLLDRCACSLDLLNQSAQMNNVHSFV